MELGICKGPGTNPLWIWTDDCIDFPVGYLELSLCLNSQNFYQEKPKEGPRCWLRPTQAAAAASREVGRATGPGHWVCVPAARKGILLYFEPQHIA